MRTLIVNRNYNAWRTQVRQLLSEQVEPSQVLWQEADDGQLLLGGLGSPASKASPAPAAPAASPATIRVPREYADLAWEVFHHRQVERLHLLYRLIWRLTHGERNLLKVEVDDDVRRAVVMQRQVTWDAHRMEGFVRFEKVRDTVGELYLAWYRPDHCVLALTAGRFVHRFASMRWSILTPDGSAHWDRKHLSFGPAVTTRPTTNDQLVELWKTYYAATNNPARANPKLFRQHVPTRFLRHMPENDAAT